MFYKVMQDFATIQYDRHDLEISWFFGEEIDVHPQTFNEQIVLSGDVGCSRGNHRK